MDLDSVFPATLSMFYWSSIPIRLNGNFIHTSLTSFDQIGCYSRFPVTLSKFILIVDSPFDRMDWGFGRISLASLRYVSSKYPKASELCGAYVNGLKCVLEPRYVCLIFNNGVSVSNSRYLTSKSPKTPEITSKHLRDNNKVRSSYMY